MRDAGEIHVERAIVHIVDHRKPQLVLSEADLDLQGNGPLRDYFGGQVANALADGRTHPARFNPEGSQAAKDECLRILKRPSSLVASSQKLAHLLFEAMGTDQRITPGSLAVCVYRAKNYPNARFLALIKLDPGEVLRQKITHVEGKKVVTFEVEPNVMPSTRERLQKAALIAPEGLNESFDLLLLDVQTPGTAAFFTVTFLNTTKAFDAETATEGLFVAVQNARNILANDPPEGVDPIDAEESFAIEHILEAELVQPESVISEFIARLPVKSEAQRDVIRDEVEKQLPGETQVAIAPGFAQEKLLIKRKLRGDFGVRFEVLAQHYDQVVLSVDEHSRDDGTLVWRMTIDVPRPKWVK